MIADNVIVLKVQTTAPSASITDKHLSADMAQRTGAEPSSMRAVKKLLPLQTITKHKDKARKLVKSKGVPWSTTGMNTTGTKKMEDTYAFAGRIIEEVANELQDLREQFFDALNVFMGKDDEDYLQCIEDQKLVLNTAFNADDYLSPEEFRAKFTWEVDAVPLMDIADVEDDFRIKLPKAMADRQIQQAVEKERKRVTNCVAEVMARAEQMILGTEKHPGLVPKLRDYNPDPNDKRAGNTFRDVSLYANVDEFREFVAGVQSFADSDRLEQMVNSIDHFRNKIRPSNPEDVRTEPTTRAKVISGLMGILSGDAQPAPKPKAKKKKASKKAKSGAAQFV